jgi:glycosyltransferase involved in cell wall biosynthesis
VLEAMAMGRPVITTDVPGCRETVVDGENGALVSARSGAALGRAMLAAASDRAAFASLGNNSRQRAVRLFSARSVAASTVEALGLVPVAELELDDALALAS